MTVLRTPEERFRSLPGYAFAPRFVMLPGEPPLRMHYVDEGNAGAGVTFLCLHGQPTWSYLYRKMIPVLATAGRVVAPDLIGFGRSDKPADDGFYTFSRHRRSLLDFIDALDLRDITLVCQDWGGILGLTLPMERPDRFTRLLVMNTALGTGDKPLGRGFEEWRAFNRSRPDLDIAALMKRATPVLTDAEAAAYAAPFPEAAFKAGVRRFPELVPATPDADGASISRRARTWWREEWCGESMMAIGCKDPVVTVAAMEGLRGGIRGCPEPLRIEEAAHFVPEWGEPIARAALERFGLAPA
ncbi:alpha/beta fold hydrolase [Erythrobacteraceae bacterium CFH 75059]|uniref:haloalkane dehalogenase n=1 Tax=Qipengyuania thermophila TaxID=2509361 RepID=UPI00101F3A63|nr:haloalkane dehalogenase [Qipengyuania thermophila]TCD02071.1 alpha/beta fold hydrolase [Erythrobacteraceae bacterium CFH 75059]